MVKIRRKIYKINEDFQNSQLSYFDNNTYDTAHVMFKLLSKFVNARISLSFNITNISDENDINLNSHNDISRGKLAGDVIEAAVISLLQRRGILKENYINSNHSPDFVYNNVPFEIKAYNKNVTNLSLGRYETIKNGLLSDNDEHYKRMVAIIFNYDVNNETNEIIITNLDVIPFIFLINKDFKVKGGGSSSVIARKYSTRDNTDFNELLDELRQILNNKK